MSWVASEKAAYPGAYHCVGMAINELFGEQVRNTYAYRRYVHNSLENQKYLADAEDVRLVYAFGYFPSHENLMKVMDLAIRYANLLVFS